jgi:preprotein translocase subunit SecB
VKNSCFNVEKVRVSELCFKVNDEFGPNEVKLDINQKTGYAIIENENRAKLKMEIELFKTDRGIAPFDLKVVMEGFFNWEEDIDKDKLEHFLLINGAAVLLSYARPIITQITTFAGFPPLILPLMNFVDSEEDCE